MAFLQTFIEVHGLRRVPPLETAHFTFARACWLFHCGIYSIKAILAPHTLFYADRYLQYVYVLISNRDLHSWFTFVLARWYRRWMYYAISYSPDSVSCFFPVVSFPPTSISGPSRGSDRMKYLRLHDLLTYWSQSSIYHRSHPNVFAPHPRHTSWWLELASAPCVLLCYLLGVDNP